MVIHSVQAVPHIVVTVFPHLSRQNRCQSWSRQNMVRRRLGRRRCMDPPYPMTAGETRR
jgi:hypothetical protein